MNIQITKRLRPLYIAAFFKAFMLWYAIEKLLMHHVGLNSTKIAISGILLSVSMVLFQIPTGILADRWSRKGVLILGDIVLIFSTLAGVLSHSAYAFYLSDFLWGIVAAIYAGTYDSIVYDLLEEETGSSEEFVRYYGRLNLYSGAALVAGSFLSGVFGQLFSLRTTYWMSFPLILISIAALAKFKEPLLHRSQAKTALLKHTVQTVRSIVQSRYVFFIVLPMVLFATLGRLLNNLPQLWYLAFSLPTLFYGPAYALIQISGSLAGPIAGFIKVSKSRIMFLALGITLSSFLLTLSGAIAIILVAQTIILTGYTIFTILLSRELHDSLSSSVRAGASSTVGTIAQLVYLPTAYLLGWLSTKYTIFQGAWVVVALTILAVGAFIYKSLNLKDYVLNLKPRLEDEAELISSNS